ncbi:hypothetical protein X946_3103 [Burkholderia sp. ABCPW 111]|nr:hypothetical protein X946_3103 [Burkholderia sp. ABCPW 111]
MSERFRVQNVPRFGNHAAAGIGGAEKRRGKHLIQTIPPNWPNS